MLDELVNYPGIAIRNLEIKDGLWYCYIVRLEYCNDCRHVTEHPPFCRGLGNTPEIAFRQAFSTYKEFIKGLKEDMKRGLTG